MSALPKLLQPYLLEGPYWNYVVLEIRVPPLASFDFVRRSHIFLCIFLPVSDLPHHKYAIISFISEHHVLGRQKTLIAYVGISVITVLINTFLPEWLKVFDLHPWILSWISTFRYPSAAFFDRPHIEGSPRYFPRSFELDMCISSIIVEQRFSFAPRLNVKVDFAVFDALTWCPTVIHDYGF